MSRIIRQILGEASDDAKKLPQALMVYVTPEIISPGQEDKAPGCRCGKCVFFKEGVSECMLTTPAKCDAEHGVCELFLGRPKNASVEGKPFGLISKEAVGYIVDKKNVPTHCGNCEYFGGEPDANGMANCWKVQGRIHENGCCNAWEPGEEGEEEEEKKVEK